MSSVTVPQIVDHNKIVKTKKTSKYQGPPKGTDHLLAPYYILAGFVALSAVTLTSVSLWSFIRKLPYYVLLEVRVDIPYFMLPAGILGFPSLWIVCLMKKNHQYVLRFFYFLQLILIISTSLLVAGASIRMIYPNKLNVDKSNLTTSIDIEHLNASLQFSMLDYNSSTATRSAWNKMQTRLRCCGVTSSEDWMKIIDRIPDSCPKEYYQEGCLEELTIELAWQRNFVSSHCYMGSVINMIAGFVILFVYVMNKNE